MEAVTTQTEYKMSKINDGGPAFPQPMLDIQGPSGIVVAEEMDCGGITMRDYFAANLILDTTINEQELAEQIVGRSLPDDDIEKIKFAYQCEAILRYIKADAMLEARKK